MEPRIEPLPSKARDMMRFDEPMAVALIVLGALGYLVLIRRGFRGLVISS